MDGRSITMIGLVAATLFAGCASDAPVGSDDGARASGCAPDGALSYVCGLRNAEDILPIGEGRWLVASSIASRGAPVGRGRLYLIDSVAKTAEVLFPGPNPALQPDRATYGLCDIALDAFDTHGLALRETSPGRHRLYATSHGAMEAIQVFEIDATGEKPTIAWRGCVPLPADVWANSVTILDDGGFIATQFIDPTDPNDVGRMLRGEVNGAAYQWRPGGPVAKLPGTDLSGANGVEQSPDGRFLFIAAFGGRRVARFDLSPDPEPPAFVAVDIAPDNLRWTKRGSLLTVGGDGAPDGGWTIYEIDPTAMTATRIAGIGGDAALRTAATALEIGGEIWIGTPEGDRVGYLRAP
jgi:hypothetical protein